MNEYQHAFMVGWLRGSLGGAADDLRFVLATSALPADVRARLETIIERMERAESEGEAEARATASSFEEAA
jgi:hypothetical protein